MFAHLSTPSRRRVSEITGASLGTSVVLHVVVITLAGSAPVREPDTDPSVAASVIRMMSLPELGPVAQPARATPSTPVHEEGSREGELASSRRAPLGVPVESPAPSASVPLPEPQLGLADPRMGMMAGGFGPDDARLPVPDTLRPVDPDPIIELARLLGGGSPPQILNRASFGRILASNYPARLLARGIKDRVLVRFVVNREGRIEPASVMVISYAEEEFARLTIKYLPHLKFSPGVLAGRPVRVSVEVPIDWVPAGS